MNSTETAKLKVEIEGDEADQTLMELQTSAKEINKALRDMKEAGEEGSDAWKELKIRQKEVNDEIKDMVKNVDLNDASMAELQASSRLLNRELRDLKIGSDEWIDKMKEVQTVDGMIAKVSKEVKGLKDDVDDNKGAWDSFKGAFMGAFTFEAVTEAAEAIYEFGQDVLETTAKFEKYNAILETTLGSSEAGAAAFDMLTEFAAKTNFGVDELTDGYIKLANRGLRPGQEELMKMADVANATGKPMGDLVEAMNDINNTDRWNEFGIKAQTNGDKVSLTFKGVTQTVDRTEEGVLKAITAFGEMEGVMGMTDKIAQTLDGQLSNMGDNFDRLKATVGGDSTEAFKGLISVGNELIDAFIEIWEGTKPVREGMSGIVDVGVRFGSTLGTLISTLFGYDDKAKASTIVTDAITLAIRIVGTTLITAVSAVQLMADGFNALMNKGKEVANFFGAEFKIDPKANFDTLAKNFEANGKAMDKLWSDGETKREATTKKTNANITDDHAKTGQAITAEAKKEADKKAKEQEKAEQDSLKKIADMQVKAIADESARKIAEINLHYDREDAAVKKSLATATTKNTQLALLATEREAKIDKVESDARAKKEKEETEVNNKLDALKAKLLTDDSARKIAELNAQAKRDLDYVNKYVTDETRRQETVKLINDKLVSDVQVVNDKHRADEEKKTAQLRDAQYKQTKQLFDNEYKEAVATSDLKLINAKNNADAIYQAKLEKLEAEYQYNRRKLETEAAEEKAKNQAMIQDADQRAAAEKSIDERLKAQLDAANAKFEADKTRLHQENLAKRKSDVTSFFSAVQDLMDGDYTSFMKILTDKITNSKKANADDKADFKLTTEDKLELAGLAVDGLIALNKKYLEDSLKKIEKEKTEQLRSWKSQYDNGTISKDEYEKKVAEIEAEAARLKKEEQLQAWKREKALMVTKAIIAGAQAALMSLASMGWPLGLIGVAGAAVATGVQIAIINRQQPPDFAKGGYVKNAGVVRGSRHGSKYGEAGISMVDRRTNQEVGEMEGDEPFMILSRNTYRNNKDTVDMLLESSLHRNGAPIYGDGGTYGDYTGKRPAYKNGGLGRFSGRRMYEDGGYSGDTSYITDAAEIGTATVQTASTTAEIVKSQRLMNDIATNTEDTVATLKDMSTFLAGPFLNSLSAQNDAFTTAIKGQVGQVVSGQVEANGYLNRIAAKDLSVSVSTVVNVWNQINVVAGKSDL